MAAGSTSTSSSSKDSNSHPSSHPSHSGKNHHPGQGSAGGKAANGLSASASNGAAAGAGMNNSMAMGMGMGGGGILHSQHGGAPHSMGSSGGLEDGDNRTRNAKAQRRHREKRKAHLKALEESVQVLTAQLEDARRQLGQAAYFSSTGQRQPGGSGGPMSPQSKDIAQLSAENAFLRDENADLRRQIYAYRSTYGHAPPPPPDVKSESGFVYPGGPPPPGGPGGMSPRRQQRGSGGDHGPEPSVPSTAEGSASASSSNGGGAGGSGYPHGVDQFTPMHQRSRSRVMSSSSAPSASPYLAQQGDGRPIDARYPGPHMRYEAQPGMYGQQPPVPRYEVQSQQHQHHGHQYAPRQEGHDQVPWTSESGPPPFGSYAMSFQQEGGSNEEWRPEH